MTERISEIKASDINLTHLFLSVETKGYAGQLLAYSAGVLILGPSTETQKVTVSPGDSVLVLDAPAETPPRSFPHFGVRE